MCDVCIFRPEKEAKCKVHLKTYGGTTTMWQEIVWPKPKNEEWHALKWVMGMCINCGILKLLIYPLESSSSSNVTSKCFENEIIGVIWERKPWKRIVEIYKETSPQVFSNTLSLNYLSLWSTTLWWGRRTTITSVLSLGKDVILSHIDFVEIYTFEIQNQIQSMYWLGILF